MTNGRNGHTADSRPCTQRQEAFSRHLFDGMNQRDAYRESGYAVATQTQATIDANASRLARSVKVLARLEELRKAADDASVASVHERKQRLSEILRASVPDFVSDKDGIKVSKDSPNVGAVSEVTTRTKMYKRTGEVAIITNLKLHNPIPAITELNKMEHIYETGTKVLIDNRKVEVWVVSEGGKELTEAILRGDGTGEENDT